MSQRNHDHQIVNYRGLQKPGFVFGVKAAARRPELEPEKQDLSEWRRAKRIRKQSLRVTLVTNHVSLAEFVAGLEEHHDLASFLESVVRGGDGSAQ